MIVLVGYVTTLCLDTRRGHPLGPVVEQEVARPGTVAVGRLTESRRHAVRRGRAG